MLPKHGHSISYNRVLEVSAQLGVAAVSIYVKEGVVCPTVMRKGLFTTAVINNIDHNPTATTATTSFHGTSFSLFQHPSSDNVGEKCESRVPYFPDSFTNIYPTFFMKKIPTPSKANLPLDLNTNECKIDLTFEHKWLEKVSRIEASDEDDSITWSVHHASHKSGQVFDHENQSFPAALSDNGNPHSCQKSQLATIIETHFTPLDTDPEAGVIILDRSALINALPPRISKTFEEYAALEAVPKVQTYRGIGARRL
ncbi:unnamed protein product [Mytilus coruscus]|uniref:Uncharacterized protein n=1 Tax=Mytilus coruscus TaxID=42192 RepID=A0A6J8DYK8_MYTCO|nr:unnamed protein product [Mytilus coruscus]